MDAKDLLLLALAAFAVFYLTLMTRAAPAAAGRFGTGFITNFFDTLGIGSFATTTAIFRKWKMVPDEQIPGTLNVGHTLPTIVQAFIFTKLVPVDPLTLIAMIGAAVAGSFLGAGVVSAWSRRRIQLGMGIALLAAVAIMLLAQLHLVPAGGTLLALTGPKLALAVAVNMLLGALMTLGIGLYAPCMILVYLLGMDEHAAFPIMMGSCAFLMPVASARFMKALRFDLRASLGLLAGGVPAVIIAATLVSGLNLYWIRWLVIAVVIYTAVGMLLAARREHELPASNAKGAEAAAG